jgi:hypothetical protein
MLQTYIKFDELHNDPVSLKQFKLSKVRHYVVFMH